MYRELSNLERGLTLSDEIGPFNIVSMVRFRGELKTETLRAALNSLQRRHTLLNVCIDRQGGGFHFAPSTGGDIPLEVFARNVEQGWLAVVEAELARRIPAQSGPLLRCIYLAPGESGQGEIILTYHHAIMDGVAAVGLWRELLELCAGQAISETASGKIPPPIEALIPAQNRGWRGAPGLLRYGLSQGWDELAFGLRMLGKPRPRVNAGVRGRVFSLSLEQSLTQALSYRCRQKGITLNSALHAAMLLAVNHKLYGGQALLMRTFAFSDMRPSLTETVPEDELGAYIALMRYTLPVQGSMGFWTLAEAINKKIYQSLKRGDRFGAAAMVEGMARLLIRTRMMRYSNTALTYNGSVSLNTQYGNITVLGLHAFFGGFDLSPQLSTGAVLFDDGLIWDMTYLDKDMDAGMATAIVEEIRTMLVEAAA